MKTALSTSFHEEVNPMKTALSTSIHGEVNLMKTALSTTSQEEVSPKTAKIVEEACGHWASGWACGCEKDGGLDVNAITKAMLEEANMKTALSSSFDNEEENAKTANWLYKCGQWACFCGKGHDQTACMFDAEDDTKTALFGEFEDNMETTKNIISEEDLAKIIGKEDYSGFYCDNSMNKHPVDKRPKLVRRQSFYLDKDLSIHAYYTDFNNPAVQKQLSNGQMAMD